jgi:hypothetical protein
MEGMTAPSQTNGQLVWRELLSTKEIEEWAVSRKQPRKLWRVDDHSWPGVYRFVFPKDKPLPLCYIGEACHIGRRVRDHICPTAKQQSEGTTKDSPGRRVRDAIKNSIGSCFLQHLTIDGYAKICGLELNQERFVDLFARRLLENWAILDSEQASKGPDKLLPLNRDIPTGIQQDLKGWIGPAKDMMVSPPGMGWVGNRAGRKRFERARP